MGLATNDEWKGSYVDTVIDGKNVWDAIMNHSPSPREEIVHFVNVDETAVIQHKNIKYFHEQSDSLCEKPIVVFREDLDPTSIRIHCTNPTLMNSGKGTFHELSYGQLQANVEHFVIGFIVLFLLIIIGYSFAVFQFKKRIDVTSTTMNGFGNRKGREFSGSVDEESDEELPLVPKVQYPRLI